ncbi:hypothetical protein N9231_05400 [Saprospiraceae bacterium]|nr:hypothetical protein [Saprospiraceae bacterium]
MSDESFSLYQIVDQDPRYPIEAYIFVREALAYASDSLELGSQCYQSEVDVDAATHLARRERHLTGQQLCEAIRQYALNQFGYMAKIVLNNWSIDQTGCFGDIVYNMIDLGIMKKSSQDERDHFNNVYEFDDVFQNSFEICDSLAQRRS